MKNTFKNIIIRVIKTMCETAIAMIGTSVFLHDVNWIAVCSATILSGIVTVLFNIAHFEELKHE